MQTQYESILKEEVEPLLYENEIVVSYHDGLKQTKGRYTGQTRNEYCLVQNIETNDECYMMRLFKGEAYTIFSKESLPIILKSKITWHLFKNGYVGYTFYIEKHKQKALYMHQVLMNYYGNKDKSINIDHINGDKLDNRMENLRIVEQSTQIRNRGKRNRQSSAIHEYPDEITHDMLPTHVYYSLEARPCIDNPDRFRDFFRISGHPIINENGKYKSSSKAFSTPILDKLQQVTNLLLETDEYIKLLNDKYYDSYDVYTKSGHEIERPLMS